MHQHRQRRHRQHHQYQQGKAIHWEQQLKVAA
jgi:hypothetical protein